MLCPQCAKEVDTTGTDWVQLSVGGLFTWRPFCHKQCALLVVRDLTMNGVRIREIEVETQLTPKMRTNQLIGRKRT